MREQERITGEPNAETCLAIEELDAGNGTFVSDVYELWAVVDGDGGSAMIVEDNSI